MAAREGLAARGHSHGVWGKRGSNVAARRGRGALIAASVLIVAAAMCLSPAEAFNAPAGSVRLGVSSFSAAKSTAPIRPASGAWGFGSGGLTKARAAPSSSVQSVSMGSLKNADKIGAKAPAAFAEGTDFLRDGKNMGPGDVVLVSRSDGRWGPRAESRPPYPVILREMMAPWMHTPPHSR